MPSFGERSRKNLESCHPDLQRLFERVVVERDCSVLCGHRDEEAQMEAYNAKPRRSKVQFPNSKHNQEPSIAVDVVPYPRIDWNDKGRFYLFVGYVLGVASQMGIDIRCGADWDGDGEVKDQNFHDLPHFELINIG